MFLLGQLDHGGERPIAGPLPEELELVLGSETIITKPRCPLLFATV